MLGYTYTEHAVELENYYVAEYDEDGFILSETYDYDGDGVSDEVWTYTYDGDSAITSYDYDGDGVVDASDTFTYDATGALIMKARL